MRNNKIFIILLFLGLLFPYLLQAENTSCKIIGDLGEVKIKPKDSKKWFKPIIGMALREKDIIITSEKSWVTICYESGSIVQLAQNSVIEISKLEYDSQIDKLDTVIKISGFGKVYLLIRKQKETSEVQFDIETPTAEAVVLGTDFMVNVPNMDSSIFTVFKGKIYLHDFLKEEDSSTNDMAINWDYLHKLSVESDQFTVYEKAKGFTIAKRINNQFNADKKIITELNNQVDDMKEQLIKGNLKAQWVESEKIRNQPLK